MKIAINTVCVPELPWPEALVACKTAGFDNIELLMVPGWAHVDPSVTPPAEVLAKARSLGLAIVGVHAGGIDAASDDSLTRTVAYIRKAMEAAAEMGAERVVFTGNSTPAGTDQAGRTAILRRIAAALDGLAERAEELKLNIALENHYHCQIETPADYEALFAFLRNPSPRLGATVDTGHYTASGVDPAAAVRELGGRIRNVHVKDHVGTQSVGLGYGQTDNAAVAVALREVGYGGYLTVELEVHDRQNALRYMREAYPYMERLAAE